MFKIYDKHKIVRLGENNMNVLIKNITIVTMDNDKEVIDKGYILIENQIIKNVEKGEFEGNESGMEIINGDGYCAIPGLYNCHTHAAMTLLRGYGEGLPLMRWLNEKIWPMEAKFKKEHIEIGTKIAILEMLRTGTIAFNDMYFYQENVMEIAEEFGIRAMLGIPIIGDDWQKQLADSEKLADKITKKNSPLIRTMFAPHSPYTLSKDALIQIGKSAKNFESGIHIHIAETEDEINIINEKYKMTPFELLEETNIFDNHTIGAHCVHVNNNDMEIIKRYSLNPVYNPQSNMKLASGISPVSEMIENGINVCMGTDGTSSNNNLNMFEEMETGALLQKLYYKDATKMDGKTVLKMATINGAKALNFKNTGAIKVGNCADIVLIDINKPNMIPTHDIYSNIVFSSYGNEVSYVIINGKIIMRKGQFVYIDEEKIIYECKKFVAEMMGH